MTCQTNCGKATSTLHLEVYPTKIELAENPYQSYNGQNYLYGFNVGDISGSSGLICIKVSPPNGAVSYPSTTKRLGRSETRYRKWSNGKWVYQMAYGSGTGISFSTCLDRIENDELYSYIYIRFTSNGTAGTGTGNVNMVASFGNLTYRYGSLSQVIPVNCLVTIYNGGTSICGNIKLCYSYSLS